jgi:proline dehydrogenase
MELFDNTEVAYARMTNYELRRAYVLFKSLQIPVIFNALKHMVRYSFRFRFPIGWVVKPTVFRQFIGGTNLEGCLPIAGLLRNYHVKAILDYSSEDGSTERVIEQTLNETLHSVEAAAGHPNIAFAVFKPTAFCSKDALEALSSAKGITPEVEQKGFKFRQYVEVLCSKAYVCSVPIMIDAEDFAFQDFVDEVVSEMMEKYNQQKAIVYNTLQMYRHDRLRFLEQSYRKAKEKGYFLGIKLVRGAYMERERIRAEKFGYLSPIWPAKSCTDDAYNKALEYCIHHIDRISLFSGSHNEDSNVFLMQLMNNAGLENADTRVWFSQLYGMSDNITYNIAALHYNVAKYIPYGPVRKVLPYLIRRAEENSSVAGQTCRELNLIHTELRRRNGRKKVVR